MPERNRRRRRLEETSSFGEEIQLFGRTTSMRGVPRIVKAENVPLKIVWCIAVVVLLAFAIYQLVEIVSIYLQYNVYTSTFEMSFHPSKDKPVFPAITICNQNPFSGSDVPSDITTREEYYQKVFAKTHCRFRLFSKMFSMGRVFLPYDKYLCHLLLSSETYFQYLGSEKAKEVGHKQNEFIIDCKVLILSGLIYDKVSCDGLVHITLVQNVQYFNCFRLNITNDYFVSEGLIAGVSLILHLGNTKGTNSKTIEHKGQIDSIGAVLTPHHPQMPALPTLDGILIPAGASSRIQAEIRQRIRLPAPYGTCQEAVDYEGYEKLKMCVADCMSKEIIKECGCVYAKVASKINCNETTYDRNNTLPYCFDINTFSLMTLFKQGECIQNLSTVQHLEHCVDSCPESCKEYQYLHDISYSNWPSIWDLENVYKRFISDKPYAKHYSDIKNAIEKRCSDSFDCYSKKLTAYQIIQNNFLEVSYRLSDHRYIRLEDIPKSRVEDVCSKVGGVLNLWSGITVIVILELFEMFCRIVKNWIHPTPNNTGVPSNNLRNAQV